MNLFEINRNKKDSIIDFVKTKFADHRMQMVNYHRNWALQLAWTRGHQHVDYNKQTKQWVEHVTQPWQASVSSNFMLPIVLDNVSRLLSLNAQWEVLPATPAEEDIQIANTATKIARDAWKRYRMRQNLIRVLFWQATTGNGFLKVGWDAETGEEKEYRKDSLDNNAVTQFMEVFGIAEESETITLKEGELFVHPVSPFNIAVERTIDIFDESPYVIESQIRPLDWVTAKFGNKWKEKLSESDEHDLFLYPYVYNEEEIKSKSGIITHEIIIEKGVSKQFENGMYCLIANDQMLVTPQNHPFEHGKKLQVHFREIYDPASVWGTCTAEQIRPQQASYNDLQSRALDNLHQCANQQWLNPTQSGVRSITNRPGGVLNYRYPFKPELTTNKPFSGQLTEQMERSRRDIQDISRRHDVSMGKNEAGVRSARSIIALQESDDTSNGSIIALFIDSLEETGIRVMQTIAQFTSENKALTILGDFNEQELLVFSGTDLIGTSSARKDYFQVRVQAAPILAMSRIARMEYIDFLIERGVLVPEKDRAIILGALGLADSFTVLDGYAADRSRQWREIQQIINGQDVAPIESENHGVHIEMIKKFIASTKRDFVSKEIVRKLNEHKDMHMRLQALELAKEQLYLQSALGEVTNAIAPGVLQSGGTGGSRNRGNGQATRGQGRSQGRNQTGTGNRRF